jgi:hypothetical protein
MNTLHRCIQDKQLTKASFLAELRGKSLQQKQQAGGAAAGAKGAAPSEQAAAGDAPAWEALQDDFSSLQSGLRMKVSTCCQSGHLSSYSQVAGIAKGAARGEYLVTTSTSCVQDWDKREDAAAPVAEETMADLGSDSDDS